MDTQQIRNEYLKFFKERGHAIIPRAKLVPDNDPTTLFTGSGMQPLLPYLLGETHPEGTRLTDSQTCIRAQDIEEVGDNRHLTFFEMLGNWSLGDYFKKEQLNWFWEFLTEKVGLDPERIYVTCFIGDEAAGIPKDTESADIWTEIFKKAGVSYDRVDLDTEEYGGKAGNKGARIAFYGEKNWWCRAGKAKDMPNGEPGGPDSEVFYLFPSVEHNTEYGEHCHQNCDCGRFIEIGNSVFMEYVKTEKGFEKLPKQNVDFGGGLERIAMAAIGSPDTFKGSLFWPIIEKLEALSGKKYDSHTNAMRVIADHLRGATFLAVDGIAPSNKEQGYVMRRLLRRAIRFAFDLGIEQNFLSEVVPVIADLYVDDYPEVAAAREHVIDILTSEEKLFRKTLQRGLREMKKFEKGLSGADLFTLYDTFGFPIELSTEEAFKQDIKLSESWQKEFEEKMNEQRQRSKTATKGVFKGGLGGQTEIHKKYHTAAHLMGQAMRIVLSEGVAQRGSNITEERLRFDFSYPEKVAPEKLKQIEDIVNEQIEKDLTVTCTEYSLGEARAIGAYGEFGDKYGDRVKVYSMKSDDAEKPFSLEICGGPHVEHTGELSEGGKKFKITKEESSSAGVRRIKAVLV